MTSTLRKEKMEPNETQETTEQQTTETQESASTQTQQTDTNAERIAQMERSLQEAHTRASQLEERLAAQVKKDEPAPKEISSTEFFANPGKIITDVIRTETERAVAPLKEFVHGMQSDTKYTSLKNKYKNDPKYKDHWDKLEPTVDRMIAENKGEINDNVVNFAVLSTMGAYVTGQLPGVPYTPVASASSESASTKEPNTRTGEQVLQPPHLRPSKDTPKEQKKEDNFEPLNENEARLARESGLSHKEYRDLQNMSPDKVVSLTPRKKPVTETQPNANTGITKTGVN